MSEWFSVLTVFWVLWLIDGLRLLPRRVFTIIGGVFSGRARVSYSRMSLPGLLPASWRMTVVDFPMTLSPIGVCNHPAGSAGRPAENPAILRAWRWEEIRDVGVARGWIFVNGESFCADTGQIKPAELLSLARSVPRAREQRIETLMALCFRSAHLRRRVRVLKRRTFFPAVLNTITFAGLVALTIYLVGDIAARVSASWSERLANLLPWVLLGLFGVHIAAVILAWRAKRKLPSLTTDKRGAALFSALLLPPQALRLRSILGDGIFPPQHPAAVVLAFGDRKHQEAYAFNVIADLRWPLDEPDQPLTREITTWHRERFERRFLVAFADAAIGADALLKAPPPDSPASCSYCPRCQDQFIDARQRCPNGVQLRPLGRRGDGDAASAPRFERNPRQGRGSNQS